MAALVGVSLGVCGVLLERGLCPTPHSTEDQVAEPSSRRAHDDAAQPGVQPPLLEESASETSRPDPSPTDPSPHAEPNVAPPLEKAYPGLESSSLAEQKEALSLAMVDTLGLDATQAARVRELFRASEWLGQGNPTVTRHAMSRAECRAKREKSRPVPQGDARCGAANMVPLYDPTRGETATDARVCIDQYEFPNIPCEYPIVWVRASEAVALCRAVGKRICDAHEWEGACAGALREPREEYAFGERRMMMEYLHNQSREVVWSYGPKADQARCATLSKKSRKCDAIDWELCGSNTYPAGAFPECRSRLGVFDQHGNAAEHMNLPIAAKQLGSRGGTGETEMKGGWFIFASYEAHPDDCRWRAPMWHASTITDASSHRNYHLGFRCCRDIGAEASSRGDAQLAAPPRSCTASADQHGVPVETVLAGTTVSCRAALETGCPNRRNEVKNRGGSVVEAISAQRSTIGHETPDSADCRSLTARVLCGSGSTGLEGRYSEQGKSLKAPPLQPQSRAGVAHHWAIRLFCSTSTRLSVQNVQFGP